MTAIDEQPILVLPVLPQSRSYVIFMPQRLGMSRLLSPKHVDHPKSLR